MTTSTQQMTADELLLMPDDGQRHELIAGELRTMSPTGEEHGTIAAAVTESLRAYVRTHRLGRVVTGESGFRLRIAPDTVRAPDVGFTSRQRLGGSPRLPGYRPGAPDLAIEVISPSDLYDEVEEKVAVWFAHDTKMVIVINPRHQTVTVYHSPTRLQRLTMADTLDGGDVVPGWTLPVSAIFEDELAATDEDE